MKYFAKPNPKTLEKISLAISLGVPVVTKYHLQKCDEYLRLSPGQPDSSFSIFNVEEKIESIITMNVDKKKRTFTQIEQDTLTPTPVSTTDMSDDPTSIHGEKSDCYAKKPRKRRHINNQKIAPSIHMKIFDPLENTRNKLWTTILQSEQNGKTILNRICDELITRIQNKSKIKIPEDIMSLIFLFLEEKRDSARSKLFEQAKLKFDKK